MRFQHCCCSCTSIALIAAADHEGLLSMGAEYRTSHASSPNFTLFGAVIISDKKTVAHQLAMCASSSLHLYDYENTTSSIHGVLASRKSNAKKLSRQLKPMKLQFWPAVHTRACPVEVSTVGSQRNELIEQPYIRHTGGLNDTNSDNGSLMPHHFRSVGCPYAAHHSGWSHFQIWQDFVFFDPDVLAARKRKIPMEFLTHSSSTVSGLFQAHANGSIHKNGRAFLDEDVIVILHDGVATRLTEEHFNGTSSLYESIASEAARMSTHMLVLGWQEDGIPQGQMHCNRSHARSRSFFSHHVLVYALSRVGARETVQHFDPCGPSSALEQIWRLTCSGLLTVAYADRNLFVLSSHM